MTGRLAYEDHSHLLFDCSVSHTLLVGLWREFNLLDKERAGHQQFFDHWHKFAALSELWHSALFRGHFRRDEQQR